MRLALGVAAFDTLNDAVGGSLWAYPALIGAVSLDSVLPLAPGEAAVVPAACWPRKTPRP